ncbi:Uncharacterised protein [Raoultella terrigena]|uniref:Uncharacterized protein n=1 Tax=Raoultella terrigena TaxID=577 RepID=A0A3P8KCC2_RAOTE|nr:Uncharacterised protein [Raoultella terrigena]
MGQITARQLGAMDGIRFGLVNSCEVGSTGIARPFDNAICYRNIVEFIKAPKIYLSGCGIFTMSEDVKGTNAAAQRQMSARSVIKKAPGVNPPGA